MAQSTAIACFRSIDGDHHGLPHLSHRLRKVPLSMQVLDEDDFADANDAGLAVARCDLIGSIDAMDDKYCR